MSEIINQIEDIQKAIIADLTPDQIIEIANMYTEVQEENANYKKALEEIQLELTHTEIERDYDKIWQIVMETLDNE